MKFRFTVTGVDCPNCAAKLAAIIEKKEGFESAKLNFLTEKLTVESSLSEDEVFAAVTACAKAFSSDIKVKK